MVGVDRNTLIGVSHYALFMIVTHEKFPKEYLQVWIVCDRKAEELLAARIGDVFPVKLVEAGLVDVESV